MLIFSATMGHYGLWSFQAVGTKSVKKLRWLEISRYDFIVINLLGTGLDIMWDILLDISILYSSKFLIQELFFFAFWKCYFMFMASLAMIDI